MTWLFVLLLLAVFVEHVHPRGYTVRRKLQLQDTVVEYFDHAFDSYMKYAFPQDELKPLSCKGSDHFGGYSLTVVDSLDTLALMGKHDAFWSAVDHITSRIHFNTSMHVSVFETTIRIVGGLLSGHALALQMHKDVVQLLGNATTTKWHSSAVKYTDGLLGKAVEIADRLMAAFDTPTGIPFNEIHLCDGVNRQKGNANCPAAAGTLLLEFGTLAAWTGNCSYLTVAKRALEGVWKHRGKHNMVGTLIDILTGAWIHNEAHIGASIDSFYEYMVKAYILFGEEKYFDMWLVAFRAVHKYTFHSGWFLSTSVDAPGVLGEMNDFKFNSLQAFWPGLLVASGDVVGALDAYRKMYCIVRDLDVMPEYVHLGTYTKRQPPQRIGSGYPLRPEFIESTFFLYQATGDDHFLTIAENFLAALGATRQKCGFAAVLDIYSRSSEDKMDSYLLAETFKYLYLIFEPTPQEVMDERRRWRVRFGDSVPLPRELSQLNDDSGSWSQLFSPGRGRSDIRAVFNTEAHPLPVTAATQAIFSKCRGHEENYFTGHNDQRKLADSFALHPHSHYEDLRPPAHALQCLVVDYMRDVAPFISEMFHSAHDNDVCYEPIDARILGHRQQTPQKVLQRGSTSTESTTTDAHVVEFPLFLPRDPLVRWSKDLSLSIRMTVLDTSIVNYVPSLNRGVLEIKFIGANPETLYVNGYNVILFESSDTEDLSASDLLSSPPTTRRLVTASAQFNAEGLCQHADAVTGVKGADKMLFSKTPIYLLSGNGCRDGIAGASDDIQFTLSDEEIQKHRDRKGTTFGIAIRRGGCTFKAKARLAELLGASFVLILNHENALIMMADVDGGQSLRIPSFLVAEADMVELQLMTLSDPSIHASIEPWFNDSISFVPLSLVCAANAKSLYASQGIIFRRVSSAESAPGTPPTSLLLFRNRFAPIATDLYDEVRHQSVVFHSLEVPFPIAADFKGEGPSNFAVTVGRAAEALNPSDTCIKYLLIHGAHESVSVVFPANDAENTNNTFFWIDESFGATSELFEDGVWGCDHHHADNVTPRDFSVLVTKYEVNAVADSDQLNHWVLQRFLQLTQKVLAESIATGEVKGVAFRPLGGRAFVEVLLCSRPLASTFANDSGEPWEATNFSNLTVLHQMRRLYLVEPSSWVKVL